MLIIVPAVQLATAAVLLKEGVERGGVDHTGEVTERVRRKNEAALFTKAPQKRRAA